MSRIVLGILFGCLLLCPVAPCETVDIEGIVARNIGTVVLIYGKRTDNGTPVQGSGCVIHPDGYILATAHQAVGVSGFSAKFADGTTIGLDLVDVQPDIEFSLFKAKTPLSSIATIGDATPLRGGAPLVSIASPVNLEFSTVSGTVANPNKTYDGYPVVLASLTATHGSSGGPVFDRQGRLIGLISGGLNEVDFTIINKINNAYPMLQHFGIMNEALSLGADEDVLVPVAGISEAELRAIDAYNRGVLSVDVAEKRKAYELASTLLPQFYESFFNLAVAEAIAGEDLRAIETYRRAEAIRPDAVEVKRNLGRLLLKHKAYDDAAAVFFDALKLAPDEAQSHNDLGEAYRRAGKLDEAIRSFTTCLNLNSDAPQVHFNLALAYVKNGQATEAVKHFNAYLALSPNARDAEQVRRWIKELQAS